MAEDNVQANIRIDIDTSDALASIKNLQRQISAFHTSMANGSAANAAAASNFQKTLIDNINATKKFSASVQTVRTTTETFTNSLEKNKLSLGEYFRYAGGASRSFGRLFSTEFDTINKVARERVKDLQTQYIRMGRDANGAMRAIAVRPLVLDMDSLATKTAIAAQRQQLLNQLLKQGSTNLLNFGKNTQWAGRQLMVGFTIPLSIFGATAAKSFMAIEDQAIRFKRVYGDLMTDQGQTDAMLESIKTLASEFTKYGVAVDKTMGLAASAAAQGKTGADLTAQVSEATRLSVLGQVEQQQALETTISVTNAFGVAAEDLASKIDFLNSVENQTVTSIEDLTIAIPKAGPVVKQLGGGVEDLAFFLTAMKEGGINASEGANALKSGLASLINPTEKASNMLAGYGINIKKIVESNKGDVKGVVIDFATALDKLDPLARARAIEQLFGKFQFSRLSTLFQNVIGEGTQASKVLEMAGKTSSELAQLSERELSKVSESSMFKFKKSIEDIKLALAPVGEIFLKLATPVVEFGTKLLTAFNNLDEKTKSFISGLVAVVGGIGPILLMTFGLLANGVANIIKGFTFVKNVFNRASVSSNDLGSQISYMTTEQIKAASVAASLDQVHGKLTQTFTSEANAIGAYVSALQKANAAAAAFNVPAVGRVRPAQKMAKGGMVRGPGGPKDDLVPTDLSNGEAVIDAATVKKNPRIIGALFAGKTINIPGYKNNNKTEFAHVGSMGRMGAGQAFATVSADPSSVSTRASRILESLAEAFGDAFKVNVYGKLGIRTGQTSTGQSINNLLGKEGVGVSKEEFLSDWDKQGLARWKDSLKYSGLKMKDVGEELSALDAEIRNQIQALDTLTIEDKNVADAYRKAAAKIGSQGSVVPAFDKLERTAGEIRANISQAWADKGGFGSVEGGGSKGAIDVNGMKVRKGSDRFTFYTKEGFAISEEAKDGIIEGVKKSTRQASPSKEAFEAGENIGKGAIQGIESQIDDAQKVGRKNRRVTAVPDGNGGMVIQSPATQATAFAATPAARTPRRVVREGDLQVRQRAEAAQKSLTTAVEETASKTRSFGTNIRNLSYVLSGLSGIALMSGQSLGEFGNVVFGASVALSALTTAAELNATTGFLKLGPAAAGAKGIGGFFSRMVNIGGKAVMTLGKFAGVAGIAITAISGFIMLANYINDQREKERLKIEGLGDAATLTAKQLTTLASFYGKEKKQTAFESVGTGVGAVSSEKRETIAKLSTDKGFQKDFEQTIKTLKGATGKQTTQTLETLSLSLFGQGYDKKIVQDIIDTIKTEAGKSKLSFNVASIDIRTKNGKAGFKKSVDNLMKDYQSAFDKGYKKEIDMKTDGNMGMGFGYKNTKGFNAQLDATAANLTQRFNALQTLFSSGEISLKDYNAQLGILKKAMTTGSGATELTAKVYKNFTEEVKKVNPEFAALLPNITGAGNQFLIMQASMSGVIGTAEELAKALQAINIIADYTSGNKGGYTFSQYRQAIQDVTALQKGVTDITKKQDELNKKANEFGSDDGKTGEDSPFIKFKKDIAAQTKELQNQLNAFRKLKAAGIETDEAFKMASNSMFAAAIAAEKVGSAKWKELINLWKTLDAKQKAVDKAEAETLEGKVQAFEDGYTKITEAFSAYEDQANSSFKITNKKDLDLIDETNSKIAALQYELDGWQSQLDDIQLKEDAINESYDKKIEALDKVSKINETLIAQQKSQLTIADALTRGDISAAAVAIQDAQAQNAAASAQDQKDRLEAARQAALGGVTVGGKTRLQIEKEIRDTAAEIKKLEDESLRPAEERIRLAEEKLQKDIKSQLVAGKTREEWDLIASNISLAKTRTDDFVTSLQAALTASESLNSALAAKTSRGLEIPGSNSVTSTRPFTATELMLRSIGMPGYSSGGVVPKYFASGGFARGTDTVPAMLTPGEFVVKKYAVDNFGIDKLKSINSGSYSGEAVYNNYELNVNVRSDANPSEIARVVMSQIKHIDSQRVRGIRL